MEVICSVTVPEEVFIKVPVEYEFYFRKDESEWSEEEEKISDSEEFFDWLYSECEKQVGCFSYPSIKLKEIIE